MISDAIIQKAKRLNVRINRLSFFVDGDEGEYSILFRNKRWSCTCTFHSVQGDANNKICSHILAASIKIRGES